MREYFSSVGAIAAAAIASVCCIGPVVLAGLSVGAVSVADTFAPWRPYFLALTAIFLGIGFYFAYRKPKQATCEGPACEAPRIARWSRPVLWVVTGVVLLLVAFPYYYGPLRAAFDQPDRAAAVNAPLELAAVELPVKGMTCEGCTLTVRNKLLETPGVMEARVDLAESRAIVKYDPAKTTPAKLVEAINATGYTSFLPSTHAK